MLPRPEHPRPQLTRAGWRSLNGEWDFAFDMSVSKRAREFWKNGAYTHKITVPFCPESSLSGVGFTDFIPAVWYRRSFTLSAEECAGRVLLHFGAVDYRCEVWVNETPVGSHKGGYSSFTFDITGAVQPGENTVVLYAADDVRSPLQPTGKQCPQYASQGCHYTRTTGIWQSVWLEFVPKTYISALKMETDPDNGLLTFEAKLNEAAEGTLTVTASFEGAPAGETSLKVRGASVRGQLKVEDVKVWDIGAPNLYDLSFTLETAGGTDAVRSYTGFRSIEWKDKKFYLNGRSVFQRLVLDQGFYPDGIYTAPSDEALQNDIRLSQAMGFNGARLHEKVFEERFLYWADKMGYLVWGEYPNWGLDITSGTGLEIMLPEWLSVVERDYNHPALIGWCPFNETWDDGATGTRQDDEVLRSIYLATKAADPIRPVIDTSGNFHVVTDIYDIHWYEQEPEVFAKAFAEMAAGGAPFDNHGDRQQYGGQPYMVSEYGGTWWSTQTENAWGYGERPATVEEVCRRYTGLADALLQNPYICGLCYTQLYDVEQEQNGLYTYAREKKFPEEIYEKMAACMKQKAAVED